MVQAASFSPTVLCSNCNHTFTPRPVGSPIANDIIRSQRSPSAVEAFQTKALVEKDERELQRYDAELTRIRSLLKKLGNERIFIAQRLEQGRSWLAPIRKVPGEVLERILFLAQEDEYSVKAQGDESRSTILALSQVCWYWRHIVTARAAWWCNIHLDICQLGKSALPVLEIHVKYSGDCKLSLSVVDSRKQERDFNSTIGSCGSYLKHLGKRGPRTLHRLLSQNTHRISYLKLDFCMVLFDELWQLGSLKGTFVNLRSLTIAEPFDYDSANRFLDTMPFENRLRSNQPLLPSLHHLSLVYNPEEEADYFFTTMNHLAALESVVLRPSRYHHDKQAAVSWPLTYFVDVIRVSNSPVKSLNIDLGSYILPDTNQVHVGLTDLFKLCTSLEDLNIRLSAFEPVNLLSRIFKDLIDLGMHLPKLKNVTIQIEGPDSSNLLLDGDGQGKARCTGLEELLGRITSCDAVLEIWLIHYEYVICR
ncbi:hypothetical protein VNI00_007771 [Paramarasmius palmivorus]|uniref:F-box domain-containing protein n=1 Tax=Paramarasmius palmivorus TaxID=297713 RepID=A0AAW0CXL2_9AGAR